jgi:hypothetical protein
MVRSVSACCVAVPNMEAPAPVPRLWLGRPKPSIPWRHKMPRATREEERLTEDEMARRKLGPRGVPGGEDNAKMTPQQAKNIPKTGDFDGHTA